MFYDFEWNRKYKERDKEYITFGELLKEGFDNSDIEGMKEMGMLIAVGRIEVNGVGLNSMATVDTLYEFREVY